MSSPNRLHCEPHRSLFLHGLLRGKVSYDDLLGAAKLVLRFGFRANATFVDGQLVERPDNRDDNKEDDDIEITEKRAA